MESVDGVSLESYGGGFDEKVLNYFILKEIAKIVYAVLNALKVFHDLKYVHNGIDLRSIIKTRDNYKLCNLGNMATASTDNFTRLQENIFYPDEYSKHRKNQNRR